MPITFRPVFGGVQCQIKAHFAGLPGTMMMTLKFAGSADLPTSADCDAVNALVDTWVADNLVPHISNGWNIFAFYSKSMAQEVPPFSAYDANYTGEQTGTATHPEAAPEILLHTGIAGRSYLGRSYVFAPEDSKITATGFNTALLNDLVTEFTALRGLGDAAGYPLVVASPKLTQVHTVLSVTHVDRYTIQKRRRIGFGG